MPSASASLYRRPVSCSHRECALRLTVWHGSFEKGEVDCVAHGAIACLIRVEMVARVELELDPLGVSRIPQDCIKIDDGVGALAVAKPIVHGRALRLSSRRIEAMIRRVFVGCQRGAEGLGATGVHTVDDLFHAGDNLIGRNALLGKRSVGRMADVVDALRLHHPASAGHAVETRQGAGAKHLFRVAVQNADAADGGIDDTHGLRALPCG
jgi:hypothetical protein